MKIAVSGAHRVGKSTLVENLLESLPEYTSRAEAYHELEEQGHHFSDLPGLDEFFLQLDYSIEQIAKGGNCTLFDRCPVDILAYIQLSYALGHVQNQTLYQRVFKAMSTLDLLIFVPIENPDVIACPENELSELRQRVNELLHEWVWDFDVPVLLVSGSALSRRNQVLQYLSKI
ncbi:MAG TPA: AAA family ATPase [Saprospiraceae bacterium]|nr:AAA family ATPase [Saprospiraceae bacterium]HNT21581.1 AAA family ATPase [Saprospiraceae bacterium]